MKKCIWALLDNRMGSVGQIKGVLNELNPNAYDIKEKQIKYTKLAALPNLLKGASLLGVKKESIAQINSDFPDIVLSASRRTAPIALWIKKKSPKTKIVQLLHPDVSKSNLLKFDRIFLPEHDKYKKSKGNCFYTIGSPHKVSKHVLGEAREKWQKVFAKLPKPLTAVIIGGSIKGKPFTLKNAEGLALEIKNLKERIGGSLLVTDSRRTGDEAEKIIMSYLKDIPAHTFLWGSKDENPLLGYYACADNIVVTGDSVSMACESCGTGCPVFVFCGEKWLTQKHLRFVQSLYDGGYAVPLQKGCEKFKGGKILFPAAQIAQEIDSL